MIEIEVKAHVPNLVELEEKIQAMGAKPTWEGHQNDTYFDHPARRFAETDEALRIREEEGRTVLTYKGPKLDSETKTREEIAVSVENAAVMKEVLHKLGFKEVASVRKFRKKYELKGLKVCLDSVEGLGEFVELEVPVEQSESHEKVDELKGSILRTFKEWGLTKTERRSYLELLLERK